MSSVFFFFEMKEFQYLDYCTEYSCEGDLVKEMDKEACFGYQKGGEAAYKES